MTYYSGSANDMAAVRSALVAACVAEGWAWNSSTEVLSKGVLFLRLQVVSGYLRLLARTSAAAGDMNHIVQVGPFTGRGTHPLPVMTYPLGYELFLFEQEVYCIINYAIDCYQWYAFGKSTIEGLPGSGMWVGATAAGTLTGYGNGIGIHPLGGFSSSNLNVCPALFWSTSGPPEESRVHSDLDGQGWWMAQTNTAPSVGIVDQAPLVSILPNSWNSEAVLLPIRGYKARASSKITLVADLENSRYVRVDNYSPGQRIVLGSDHWKVYPWFRKNSAVRDGGFDHSGTLGWAIRYEGP